MLSDKKRAHCYLKACWNKNKCFRNIKVAGVFGFVESYSFRRYGASLKKLMLTKFCLFEYITTLWILTSYVRNASC